jgi:hypothetical protein
MPGSSLARAQNAWHTLQARALGKQQTDTCVSCAGQLALLGR